MPNLLDKNAIRSLIPQGGAMCLLETVSNWDADTIECIALGHRAIDNPLRRDGLLPAVAGVEYAAQAIALHGALNTPTSIPRRGYLATLSDVRWSVERLDDAALELVVRAQRLSVSENGANYTFSLRSDERELMTGTVLVALEIPVTSGPDCKAS